MTLTCPACNLRYKEQSSLNSHIRQMQIREILIDLPQQQRLHSALVVRTRRGRPRTADAPIVTMDVQDEPDVTETTSVSEQGVAVEQPAHVAISNAIDVSQSDVSLAAARSTSTIESLIAEKNLVVVENERLQQALLKEKERGDELESARQNQFIPKQDYLSVQCERDAFKDQLDQMASNLEHVTAEKEYLKLCNMGMVNRLVKCEEEQDELILTIETIKHEKQVCLMQLNQLSDRLHQLEMNCSHLVSGSRDECNMEQRKESWNAEKQVWERQKNYYKTRLENQQIEFHLQVNHLRTHVQVVTADRDKIAELYEQLTDDHTLLTTRLSETEANLERITNLLERMKRNDYMLLDACSI